MASAGVDVTAQAGIGLPRFARVNTSPAEFPAYTHLSGTVPAGGLNPSALSGRRTYTRWAPVNETAVGRVGHPG